MKSIINFLPNTITLLNLLCGVIGILFFWYDNIFIGPICVFIAIFFDFLDGLIARLLKVTSNLGKELDSLADVISFGLLPSLIVFRLLHPDLIWLEIKEIPLISFLVLLIPLFSALRLAKFNIDSSQQFGFKGLPTPANALLIASLPLIIYNKNELLNPFFINSNILLLTTIIFAFLLISPLPLIALKFQNFSFKKNIFKYSLIVSALVLLVLFKWSALPLIICLYIVFSLLNHFFSQKVSLTK